jgi:hypothetical protein
MHATQIFAAVIIKLDVHEQTQRDGFDGLSLFQGAQDNCELQICKPVSECERGGPARPAQAVITHSHLGHQKCPCTEFMGKVILLFFLFFLTTTGIW